VTNMDEKNVKKEDMWIPTACNMCFNACSILVHKIDGVVVKIEGNPKSMIGEGRVCAKGAGGMMQLYDPNRKSKPMKRTNPKKGLDQDPGWVEISWDEAYSLAAEKIGDALKRDPKLVQLYEMVTSMPNVAWLPNYFVGVLGAQLLGSDICGAGIHAIYDLNNGTGNASPDYDYCKYVLQFGTNAGTASRHAFNMTVRRFADARMKGCKFVSVDPHMGPGPEKADMWLPIRPGTDGALALGIAYVLVHELGLYDREYLKTYTNGPYLVDVTTQRFFKDEESKKPFVYDLADNSVKVWDDPSIQNVSLVGTYEINGKTYKTGFQIYIEHIKKYTPEYAAEITTIPAAKIRQVAKEFGEAANIGGTIVIDGQEFPYRPAAADCFSGVTRHKHGWLSMWAIFQLNTLVGSHNVPGGLVGFAVGNNGYPGTGKPSWYPRTYKPEGMLDAVSLVNGIPLSYYKTVQKQFHFTNSDLGLFNLQPMNHLDAHFAYTTQLNNETYKQNRAEVLIVYGGNIMKNWGNSDLMADFMRTYKYVISIDLYLNDTSYFADLYLPEATYLERYEVPPNTVMNHHTLGTLDVPWTIAIRQPVVESRDGAPCFFDMLLELSSRWGVIPKFNEVLNRMWRFEGENVLSLEKRYTFPEILDRIYKNWCGPEHGLEWFKENGVLTYPRTLKDRYLYPYSKARIPIYLDLMLEAKQRVIEALKGVDIPWELDDYQPVPDWKPCLEYKVTKPGYDLFPIYYTNAFNVDSWGLNNPWINEINEQEPYGYNIEINSVTAKAKGLKSGDRVTLQSTSGHEVKGRVILVEGIHPEVLAVAGGCLGVESKYLPIAKGKGTAVASLGNIGAECLDHVTANYDQCFRVKVIKDKA
jgi:anaerobic selenocysteine-containing dehydrogenase